MSDLKRKIGERRKVLEKIPIKEDNAKGLPSLRGRMKELFGKGNGKSYSEITKAELVDQILKKEFPKYSTTDRRYTTERVIRQRDAQVIHPDEVKRKLLKQNKKASTTQSQKGAKLPKVVSEDLSGKLLPPKTRIGIPLQRKNGLLTWRDPESRQVQTITAPEAKPLNVVNIHKKLIKKELRFSNALKDAFDDFVKNPNRKNRSVMKDFLTKQAKIARALFRSMQRQEWKDRARQRREREFQDPIEELPREGEDLEEKEPSDKVAFDGIRTHVFRFENALNEDITDRIMEKVKETVQMRFSVLYAFECQIFRLGGEVVEYRKTFPRKDATFSKLSRAKV